MTRILRTEFFENPHKFHASISINIERIDFSFSRAPFHPDSEIRASMRFVGDAQIDKIIHEQCGGAVDICYLRMGNRVGQ